MTGARTRPRATGGSRRRTRRAAVVLAVLAVLLLGAGALLATTARPVERVTAALPSTAEAPLVVLSPRLLGARDGSLVVSARGGGPVLVARGTAADVEGWARGTTTSTATGLDDDGAVRVERAEGGEPAPDPAGSDLWTAQQRGQGSAQLTLEAPPTTGPGAQAVLVTSDGTSPAPSRVEVTWSSRPVPVLAPVLLGAGVASAAAAVVVALRGRPRPRRGAPPGAAAAGEVPAAAEEVTA